jgi:5'-3' exoribonuclease 2
LTLSRAQWLSTKYPKIILDCTEHRVTWTESGERVPVDTSQPNPNGVEYDQLYLDMNGIIHPASHPEDRPAPETEDDMFISVTDYLERVFAAVRPRKLLFMAIDGCAPRAKMNQQRSRRFRSAQEAQERQEEEARLREEWAREGREVPPPSTRKPFDSNVITPGTPFMDRLATHLRAFTHAKLSSDPGWAGIQVVLSDGSVVRDHAHPPATHPTSKPPPQAPIAPSRLRRAPRITRVRTHTIVHASPHTRSGCLPLLPCLAFAAWRG